jgi:hybrid cluster-associated redox disulfide protein
MSTNDCSSDLIGHDDLVSETLERWPETLRVFLDRRMACPGCVMASFMTVAEAARSYGLEPAELVADLCEVAQHAHPAACSPVD